MPNQPYLDSPVEQRVADLRFIKREEESEELSFLEEYLKWKNDGGAEKMAAQKDEQMRKEIIKENRGRIDRAAKRERG
jgi:hypothetical protein